MPVVLSTLHVFSHLLLIVLLWNQFILTFILLKTGSQNHIPATLDPVCCNRTWRSPVMPRAPLEGLQFSWVCTTSFYFILFIYFYSVFFHYHLVPLYCCPCPWVLFPFCWILPPSKLSPTHNSCHLALYGPVSILLVSSVCSLDSIYEWNHMLFVFLWLAYFT